MHDDIWEAMLEDFERFLEDAVDGKSNSSLIGPFKGINKEIKGISPDLYIKVSGSKTTIFCLFLGGMEGLGSSGRLVGSISTYSGTYKCRRSGVMAKNPEGGFVYRPR